MPYGWLAKLRSLLLDLLFPRHCIGCGRPGVYLCSECRASLPYLQPPYCAICGRPLFYGRLCLRCQHVPLQIDGIRGICLYQGIAREAIHQFKYQGVRELAEPLGEMLYDYWRSHRLPGTLVVPVPLHPHRLRRRGYNQASLLAAAFGQRAGLPVADNLLWRRRDTPSQVEMLDLVMRWQNVQGAFTCSGASLTGQRILLIDDVATTGATLEACATALRAGGATSVWALVFARATGR